MVVLQLKGEREREEKGRRGERGGGAGRVEGEGWRVRDGRLVVEG